MNTLKIWKNQSRANNTFEYGEGDFTIAYRGRNIYLKTLDLIIGHGATPKEAHNALYESDAYWSTHTDDEFLYYVGNKEMTKEEFESHDLN